MEALKQHPTERSVEDAGTRKPWHAPVVRVVSVPGVTATAPGGTAGDGFACFHAGGS